MKLSLILLIQYLIKSANIPCLSDNYFRCIYVFNLRFLVLSFVCELCHYCTFIYTWCKLNTATMAKKCFIILHSFYDRFKSGFFVRFVVLLISCFVFLTITFFDFMFSFTLLCTSSILDVFRILKTYDQKNLHWRGKKGLDCFSSCPPWYYSKTT